MTGTAEGPVGTQFRDFNDAWLCEYVAVLESRCRKQRGFFA